jgi:hypothetical protein
MYISGHTPKFARKLMFGGQKKPVQPLVFFCGNKFNVGGRPRTKFGDLIAPILEHKTADFGLGSIEPNNTAPSWGKSIKRSVNRCDIPFQVPLQIHHTDMDQHVDTLKLQQCLNNGKIQLP